MLHDRQRGTVCDDDWDPGAAAVVRRPRGAGRPFWPRLCPASDQDWAPPGWVGCVAAGQKPPCRTPQQALGPTRLCPRGRRQRGVLRQRLTVRFLGKADPGRTALLAGRRLGTNRPTEKGEKPRHAGTKSRVARETHQRLVPLEVPRALPWAEAPAAFGRQLEGGWVLLEHLQAAPARGAWAALVSQPSTGLASALEGRPPQPGEHGSQKQAGRGQPEEGPSPSPPRQGAGSGG